MRIIADDEGEPFEGKDGPLAGLQRSPVDLTAASNAMLEELGESRREEQARRVNEAVNVQEELAERERRIAEYDAAAEERAAARAARELAEQRRGEDLRRETRRFRAQFVAVLVSVALAAVGVTVACFAYFAPRQPEPVVVPPPEVTVLPAPVVVGPPGP